jgi:predicted lipoprotein with Yx(FWY)xxD motif
MLKKCYAWSTSIAVVAILTAGCNTGQPWSATCTTSVSTTSSLAPTIAGVCSSTPSAISSSVPASATPASAAPMSSTMPSNAPSASSFPASPSPSAVISMPLSTATLLGSSGFVNGSSFTVYVFDADLLKANASTCTGACSGVWPPVTPPSGTLPSGWTSFQRQDGSMQLAYKGRALYTYTGDPAPGNTNGDGLTAFGGVWHVARP